MKANTRFNLSNSPNGKGLLLLVFSYGLKEHNPLTGKDRYLPFIYSTGLNVSKKHWIPKEQKLDRKDPYSKDLPFELETFRKLITDVFNQFQLNGVKIPTHAQLKEKMDEYTQKTQKVTINSNIADYIDEYTRLDKEAGLSTEGRRKKYTGLAIKIREFEAHAKLKMTFENLTEDLYVKYWAYTKSVGYDKKDRNGEIKHFFYSKNYENQLYTLFRKFTIDAEKKGYRVNFDIKKYYIGTEEADTTYNDSSELQRLINLDFPAGSSEDRIRDIFILCSFIGLRHGDTINLNEIKMQKRTENGKTIEIFDVKTSKTGKHVLLPSDGYFAPVKMIYEKYNGNFPHSFVNQYFNRVMKKIARDAGFNEIVQIKRTRNQEIVVENFEKWELMTAHTARRNCITNLYKMGVPDKTIMELSGHTDYRSYQRYVRANKSDHLKILADITGKASAA